MELVVEPMTRCKPLAKRTLYMAYPGTVSKIWLVRVNDQQLLSMHMKYLFIFLYICWKNRIKRPQPSILTLYSITERDMSQKRDDCPQRNSSNIRHVFKDEVRGQGHSQNDQEMVCDTRRSHDASAHQIYDSYLKEYRRYAPDTIILKR